MIKQLSRRYHGAVYENPLLIGQRYCHDQIKRSYWLIRFPFATNGEARFFLQTAVSAGS